MNSDSKPTALPSELDADSPPFDVEALETLFPKEIPMVVPVQGFSREHEQFGTVLYECTTQSCSARLTAGGHGHAYFLRLWGSTPPRDPVSPDMLNEALSIIEPTPASVDVAKDKVLPHLRARYDGIYEDNASFTITRFADPPSNGPAVRTCSSCGSRLQRHPVYVWPDDMTVPEWWQAALEEYTGPVLSPKGLTENNPAASADESESDETGAGSGTLDDFQTGLESF